MNSEKANAQKRSFGLLSYILLSLALTSLIPLLLYLVGFHYIIQHNIKVTSEHEIKQQWERAESALGYAAMNIGRQVKDYAMWDDMCKSLQEKDEEWFYEEVVMWLGETFNYDLFLVFDGNRRLFFYYPDSLEVDPESIKAARATAERAFEGIDSSGIIPIGEKVYITGTSPIYPTDGSGPPRGVLLCGRQLTTSLLSDISRQVGGETIFFNGSKISQSKGFPASDDNFLQKIPASMLKNGFCLHYFNNHNLFYAAELKDIRGNPVGALGTTLSLQELQLTLQRTCILFSAAVLFFSLLLAIASTYFLVKTAVRPVIHLDKAVAKFRKTGRFTLLSPAGPKEIKSLIASFNETARILREQFKAMRKASVMDELTSLYNRRYLLQRLKEEIARSNREGRTFAVLFLDVDNLKPINDTYGHAIGDEALKGLTKTIRSVIRISDVAGRLSGDEFLIILPKVDKEEAEQVARRIGEKLKEEKITKEETTIPLPGVSFGIAVYPKDGTSVEELIKAADERMYRNKTDKKNIIS